MPEITIDDSDDEDLKRAIALSLQADADETVQDACPPRDDDDEDEDEDFKRAIALSLQNSHPMSGSNQPTTSISETVSYSDSTAQPQLTGNILGLDRRKMEEERLSRLAKKRQTSDVNAPPEEAIEPSGKGLKTSHQPASSITESAASRKPNLQYPQGAIRKTWSPILPRGGDIKIEEVLNAEKAKVAIICSYAWDLDWLFTKFNVRMTKLLLVLHAETEGEREERAREAKLVGKGRIGVCFPPLEGVAKIHSKFMLLAYEDSLRLVVTSANMTPYDWGETGVLENVVFVIDLPRLAAPDTKENLTVFGKELLYFLTKANLPPDSLKSLLKFDFSATRNMAFVHSIAGPHSGPDMLRNGINSLSKAIIDLNLQPPVGSALHLDYATASLGALNPALLHALYRASRGIPMTAPPPRASLQKASTRKTGRGDGGPAATDEPLARVNLPAMAQTTTLRGRKGRAAIALRVQADVGAEGEEGGDEDEDEDDPKVRVHFPSSRTVRHSRGGPDAAGTITFQEKQYASASFPRAALRDHVSTRAALLSHGKVLLAHSESGDRSEATGWAYVGSANLSASAWGRVVNDRKGGGGVRLDVANWECGVLVPVPAEKRVGAVNGGVDGGRENGCAGEVSRQPLHEDGGRLRRLFAPVLDVPFELPGKRYGAGDEPWFFEQHHSGRR